MNQCRIGDGQGKAVKPQREAAGLVASAAVPALPRSGSQYSAPSGLLLGTEKINSPIRGKVMGFSYQGRRPIFSLQQQDEDCANGGAW